MCTLYSGTTRLTDHNMDFIKPEPEHSGQAFRSSAHSDHQATDVKQDEEPMVINLQLMKTENEVLVSEMTVRYV